MPPAAAALTLGSKFKAENAATHFLNSSNVRIQPLCLRGSTLSELKKSLGFLPLIALGVAGVVGTSWIYTNGKFFSNYGAGGMIFGLLAGTLLAGCVALAYSELATLFPRAGGEVVYSYVALNRPLAFMTGWLLIGAYVSSLAFYVTAFGFLLADIFPSVESIPLYEINDTTVYLPVLLIGIILAAAVFALNWFGVSLGAQLQLVLFAAMLVLGIALVAVGFLHGSPSNFWPAYAPDQNAAASTLRFIVPAMTYLAGFGLVAVMAEDANMESRKIGRAVVLTVFGAGLFYSMVLLSSAWVLPWQDVAAMDKGTIDAFRTAGFPLLGWAAYAIAVLGLLTSFIGLFVATSRIIMALGRARLLPEPLARINPKHGTPSNALIFTVAASLGLGWLGPGAVGWFLDTGGIYLGLVWILVVASMYRLPRRYPELERAYTTRLRWAPMIGAVGALAVIIFALIPNTGLSLVWPAEHIILAVWLCAGLLLYRFVKPLDRDEALRELLGEHHYAMLSPKEDSRL